MEELRNGSNAMVNSLINRSTQLLKTMLRGEDTSHRILLAPDTWEGVGPYGRIKISARSYKIVKDGESAEDIYGVIRQSEGVTIKPILEHQHDTFLIFLYKPNPPIGQWSLELPRGVRRVDETIPQGAQRVLEQQTGFRSSTIKVLMQNMKFIPFLCDQKETVLEASGLDLGVRDAQSEKSLIEVHAIHESMLRDLLRSDIINDFRTRAIVAEHLMK